MITNTSFAHGAPGKTAHIRLLHHGSANTGAGRYVAAPLALWNQGWILTLPARAVGIYLVLKEATGGNANKAATLPGTRKAQYGLSPDTWTRATHELEMAGLLTVKEVFAKASPPRTSGSQSDGGSNTGSQIPFWIWAPAP